MCTTFRQGEVLLLVSEFERLMSRVPISSAILLRHFSANTIYANTLTKSSSNHQFCLFWKKLPTSECLGLTWAEDSIRIHVWNFLEGRESETDRIPCGIRRCGKRSILEYTAQVLYDG
ncbi:hypothetical protein RvY_15629 [Ramazzottius varieornatus]|uniref:Uncharacterized protein n=1 Tax=Ramazzottius varieornatus TaxID=947166 RepID=A0A1D1W076_RAMVA|nr:hypothetical protein RvY_15629 [Ramazzottius varieornatus]